MSHSRRESEPVLGRVLDYLLGAIGLVFAALFFLAAQGDGRVLAVVAAQATLSVLVIVWTFRRRTVGADSLAAMQGGEGGTLVIQRAGGYADGGRAYRVMVDDVELGRVRKNQSVRLAVAPGLHRVELRIDWTGSKPVNVHVEQGQELTLLATRPGRTFTRDGYLALEVQR